MIICFSCSVGTKAQLDRLVATGHYQDHGEAITAAIQNLTVIHSELKDQSSIVIDRRALTSAEREGVYALADEPAPAQVANTTVDRGVAPKPTFRPDEIPALFQRHANIAPPEKFAHAHVTDVRGKGAAVDRWMFGQYNRLLPAKVTCRALANIFADGRERQPLEKIAHTIANEAAKLGQHLARLDAMRNLGRDDALAVAFPKNAAEFKSIQRFANQFVASANKGGELSGLAVSLNLVGPNPDYEGGIALTEAGWRFAVMENPLLDRNSASEKFSADEISFLLDHISASVPVEAFAYQAILNEIARNILTPDALDEALTKLPNHPKAVLHQFVSTQRSGAICRMADMDLIGRSRTGTRVSYVMTPRGKDFLRSVELDAFESAKNRQA